MLSIDLDVTRSVRAYMASQAAADFSLERVLHGLREAIWYSPKDRRALRAVCDAHPRDFTRWLYAREGEGRYTGLLMVWPAGHTTSIHDHAGLWGIEMVLQGTLAVDDYELDAISGQPRFTGTTVLDEGDSCAFLGTHGHAHRCANASARRPAVTLHLYGGLLDSYRTFAEAGDTGYEVRRTLARIDGHIGPLGVGGV